MAHKIWWHASMSVTYSNHACKFRSQGSLPPKRTLLTSTQARDDKPVTCLRLCLCEQLAVLEVVMLTLLQRSPQAVTNAGQCRPLDPVLVTASLPLRQAHSAVCCSCSTTTSSSTTSSSCSSSSGAFTSAASAAATRQTRRGSVTTRAWFDQQQTQGLWGKPACGQYTASAPCHVCCTASPPLPFCSPCSQHTALAIIVPSKHTFTQSSPAEPSSAVFAT